MLAPTHDLRLGNKTSEDSQEVAYSEVVTSVLLQTGTVNYNNSRIIECLMSWNIHDGKASDRKVVLGHIFSGSFMHMGLICLQECTWMPHRKKKSPRAKVSKEFQNNTNISANSSPVSRKTAAAATWLLCTIPICFSVQIWTRS